MPSILVLTTTFPLSEADSTNPFVKFWCEEIENLTDLEQIVLAPHKKGGKAKEQISKNIFVKRIRYAYPASLQTVFYDGGAASKKKGPLFALLAGFFVVSLFFNTLFYAVRSRAKIIHAHWLIPSGLVAVLVGKILRRKVSVTIHGSDIFTMNGTLGRFLKKLVLRLADKVFVNSSITKAAAINHLDREYLFGPMGVDFEIFGAGDRSQIGPSKDVIFAGRLTEQKGVRYLIDAMPLLPDDVTLSIVGDGPEYQPLVDQVTKLGLGQRVSFLGWVKNEQLPGYFARSALFVGPSITLDNGSQEGMGLVYLEALFSGVPVITTRNTGARDFVFEGQNGFVVAEKNSEDLADAILRILAGEIDQDVLAATVDKLKGKYAWDVCAQRYVTAFEGWAS